jgi:hypothetical protein
MRPISGKSEIGCGDPVFARQRPLARVAIFSLTGFQLSRE